MRSEWVEGIDDSGRWCSETHIKQDGFMDIKLIVMMLGPSKAKADYHLMHSSLIGGYSIGSVKEFDTKSQVLLEADNQIRRWWKTIWREHGTEQHGIDLQWKVESPKIRTIKLTRWDYDDAVHCSVWMAGGNVSLTMGGEMASTNLDCGDVDEGVEKATKFITENWENIWQNRKKATAIQVMKGVCGG